MNPRAQSRPPAAATKRPLRVGMICTGDPHDPSHLSGMPYQTMHALTRAGVDVVPLSLAREMDAYEPLREFVRRVAGPLRDLGAVRSLRASLRERRRHRHAAAEARSTYEDQVERARAHVSRVLRQIEGRELDLLFGICISTALYEIETDLPVVYSSDATATLIFESYALYTSHGPGYKRACMEFENATMTRVDAGIFPSRRTLESAVDHHGLPPDRSHLVPLGANVLPRPDQRIAPDAPSRAGVELVIVAADPERKRLDLCVEVTECLNARGIAATLNSIGPATPRAAGSAFVNCMGPLRLGEPLDLAMHQDVLQRSHLMLLPSKGEMFGIAPCEAAHFGRPSLVADVGGLSTVVEHGRTGLVLPQDADAETYADAIAELVDDAGRYDALSAGALERARSVLSWDAYAERCVEVFRKVLSDRRRSFRRAGSP